MSKPFNTIEVPSEPGYKYINLNCVPAFRPDAPRINVSIGEAPAYKANFNAPRPAINECGDLIYSVARFLWMVEILLADPLKEYYWRGISIYSKIDLLYTMTARLRISLPLYIADFREKELNGKTDYAKIDAFQIEALQRTADTFTRDPRTGQIRVIEEIISGSTRCSTG